MLYETTIKTDNVVIKRAKQHLAIYLLYVLSSKKPIGTLSIYSL